MSKTAIETFLRSTGGSEILIEIGHGSATFQDIESTVLASGSTVSTRLSDGRDADLIEIQHRPTDHGTQKRYTLTKLGKRVFNWAEKTDFHRKVRERRRVNHERETKLEEFIGKVNRDKSVIAHGSLPEPAGSHLDGVEHLNADVEGLSEAERKAAEYERMEADLVGVTDKQADERGPDDS